MLKIEEFSKNYTIRRINKDDIPMVYELCQGNPLYYEHMKTELSMKELSTTLTDLPPNKALEDKYFVGIYEKDTTKAEINLVAILDLIDGYPESNVAYIGWFMMNHNNQGKGDGTKIISDLINFLQITGFDNVQLAYVKSNPQSKAFWTKNQFISIGECEREKYTLVKMKRIISNEKTSK